MKMIDQKIIAVLADESNLRSELNHIHPIITTKQNIVKDQDKAPDGRRLKSLLIRKKQIVKANANRDANHQLIVSDPDHQLIVACFNLEELAGLEKLEDEQAK